MRLISHRGNITGPNPDFENSPAAISNALSHGYDVEIDLWFQNGIIYLGHDRPTFILLYQEMENMKHDSLWWHAKNIEGLVFLSNFNSVWKPINYFWHQADYYTLTSKNFIWTYPSKELTPMSICVHPENTCYTKENIPECYGVCSDFIKNFK